MTNPAKSQISENQIKHKIWCAKWFRKIDLTPEQAREEIINNQKITELMGVYLVNQ